MGVLMRKQKKIYFFVSWPFCKGPSKRVGIVLKKTKMYQMILKNSKIGMFTAMRGTYSIYQILHLKHYKNTNFENSLLRFCPSEMIKV